MPSSKPSTAETLLATLIHDLRQDLGNIETSVYCLNLATDPKLPRGRDYLRAIEQQVERAESRLAGASAALARLRAQRGEGVENLDLTNSATSAVT